MHCVLAYLAMFFSSWMMCKYYALQLTVFCQVKCHSFLPAKFHCIVKQCKNILFLYVK